MLGGLKYCSACEAIGNTVLLIYGAELLPLICDQLWFSKMITNTVRMPAGGATVTWTAADVPRLPAASQALAVRVCAPAATALVFQLAVSEEEVPLPMAVPSASISMCVTPTSSVAVAVTATVPLTVAPCAGAVICAVGGVVSGVVLVTVTEAVALCDTPPLVPVTVKVVVPAAALLEAVSVSVLEAPAATLEGDGAPLTPEGSPETASPICPLPEVGMV